MSGDVLLERRRFIQKNQSGSCFSAAATSTIRSTFGNSILISAIQYASDKPTIITYVNAYVVDDPYILFSIIPNLGTERGLKTTGTAKFDLGFAYDDTMALIMDVSLTNTNDENCFLTDGNWSGGAPLWIVYHNTIRWHIPTIDWDGTVSPNTRYVIEVESGAVTVNGNTTQGSWSQYSGSRNMILWGVTLSTNPSRSFQGTMYSFKVKAINIITHWYVPHVQNGVVGLLDLITGSFSGPSVGSVELIQPI